MAAAASSSKAQAEVDLELLKFKQDTMGEAYDTIEEDENSFFADDFSATIELIRWLVELPIDGDVPLTEGEKMIHARRALGVRIALIPKNLVNLIVRDCQHTKRDDKVGRENKTTLLRRLSLIPEGAGFLPVDIGQLGTDTAKLYDDPSGDTKRNRNQLREQCEVLKQDAVYKSTSHMIESLKRVLAFAEKIESDAKRLRQ